MSIEQLRSDLKDTIASVKNLNAETTTVADLVKHFKFTLYPTLEMFVDEMDEIDGCVSDMLEGTEDILQPETAKVFSGIIVGGQVLVSQLRVLAAADPKLVAACDEWLKLAVQGAETLTEITLDPADADDDTNDEDDDNEDDAEGAA